MPTGNGGITQGLALRLTNMEQGRREVTANQFRREQMNAMNEQSKAAADYRKALAEQKEAARQEKQISELQKSINVKGLHPIYQDVANRESAEFISRTIEGMKKVPNYTTSGEYLQDKDKVMGHQNMRIASSTNIFNGEKKVTKNADDYELQSDMYDAMKDLNYEGFIKANGGSDYVMADGNIQPKFNRAKVAEAMIKGSTEGEPIIDVPSEVGGFIRLQQKQPPNPEKLQALRDSYMGIISNSGMNNKDFIKQAQQIDEVYQSVKKSENVIGEKIFKRSRSVAEELALSQGKLNQKTAYNAAEREAKAEEKTSTKVTKNGNTTTYTTATYTVDESRGSNGSVLLYKTKTGAMPSYSIPDNAVIYDEDGNPKEITGKITPSQMHVMDNGNLLFIGDVEQAGKPTKLNVKVFMPKDQVNGTIIAKDVYKTTNHAVQLFYDKKSDKWQYKINANIVAPKIAVPTVNGGGNSTSGNKTAPTNTKPAGGGQKKAAPKKGKATKPFNNSLNIQ